MTLKTLAITTGDPAGVGPEISLRTAMLPEVARGARLVLVGARPVLEKAAALAGFSGRLVDFGKAEPREGDILVLDPGGLDHVPAPGVATAEGGHASFTAIESAIAGATAGRFHGVVTAPINKLALHLAGIDFPGHTEVFGERTAPAAYAMLMYSRKIAVGLVTCHQSLASVPGSLRRERIVEVGKLLSESIRRIRGEAPVIAALGLNPHAGESGLFGNEERDIIAPAVADLEAMGIRIEGPLPPDTAFTPDKLARYGAHLCMYHDQGLIPFKMLAFDEGVNVTMGLPFPRTSVDHGTAYDIAWTGKASISSLIEAIHLAGRLAG